MRAGACATAFHSHPHPPPSRSSDLSSDRPLIFSWRKRALDVLNSAVHVVVVCSLLPVTAIKSLHARNGFERKQIDAVARNSKLYRCIGKIAHEKGIKGLAILFVNAAGIRRPMNGISVLEIQTHIGEFNSANLE